MNFYRVSGERGTYRQTNLTSSNIRTKKNKPKSKLNVVKQSDVRDVHVSSGRKACDWLTTHIMLTNETAGKRKVKFEEDNYDNWGRTKKRRPGSATIRQYTL